LWTDGAIALGIGVLAVKEAGEAWAGDACCTASSIPTADDFDGWARDRCR
jgi:hypothetical protein